MTKPHEYKKKALVVVGGLSPQVLTETLYGLVMSTPAFVPTEIHLVTTSEGSHRAMLDLLHPETGKFHSFCCEFGLPEITFDENSIHVMRDQSGMKMNDIRTPLQNEAAADFITNIIAKLTEDDQLAIHASIAGGRKTMGYYLGYALSLYGRDQDRLSHVLVSEGYEGHPEFFYPTKKSKVIYTRDNRPVDTSLAEVVLAEIPFIRFRDDVPAKLLNGKASFSETINLARKSELPAELIIDPCKKLISATGVVFKMSDSLLSFYSWVLRETLLEDRVIQKPHDVDPNMGYASSYLKEYEEVAGELRDIDKTEAALSKGMDGQFFTEKLSRINKCLEENLGKRLAAPYKIKGHGSRGSMFYSTAITADQYKQQTLI